MNQDEMLDRLSYHALSKGPEQPLRLALGELINTASKRLLWQAHSKLDPLYIGKPTNLPLN